MDVIVMIPRPPEEVDWLLTALAAADTSEEQEQARAALEEWARPSPARGPRSGLPAWTP